MEIRKAGRRELRWMKKVYIEAFPEKERKPFKIMKRKAAQGTMELLVISDRGHPVGLAVTALYQDMVLLDYFAVHGDFRGKNYGSEALGLLRKRYQDRRFLLEIELPDEHALNQQERIRRKSFYLKNGMQETGIHVCVFGVPMEVLADGKQITFGEYQSIYRNSIGLPFAAKVKRL